MPRFYTLFVFSLDPDHKSMLILHQKSWLLQFLYRKAPIRGLDLQPLLLHSPSKCLAWVKKCCHVLLDQNFYPSFLTNKLWLFFMGMKQKNSKWPKNTKNAFLPVFELMLDSPKLYIPSTLNNSNRAYTFICLGRAGRFGQC